ncbi:MAG: AAC(3) family N-acetyltransferase [Spirochaetes bacterium]|nr:AAC(3) family N-acetyltransferase [Spirochaetota bacterium]
MIYSKNDLIGHLKLSGLNQTDTVHIHSSMKAVGKTYNGADSVLDAFIEYFAEGLLTFPTHTWSTINKDNLLFDPMLEKPCVGIISSFFLNRPGVVRSLHPTHSIAAVGKNSEDFVAGEEESSTPCSKNGCYGKLYDYNSRIVFLGCSLKSNTIIHGAEEWNNIPDRLSEDFLPLKIKKYSGEIIERPMRTHSQKYGDISRNYDKIEPLLLKNKIAHETRIGDARTIICNTREMIDYVSGLLQKNPDLFIDSEPVHENW